MKRTVQLHDEILTRAPAGGIVGLNGQSYAGGEFLPLTARGGAAGSIARESEAKKAEAAANGAEIARLELAKRQEMEAQRRAILAPLFEILRREMQNEPSGSGFWHNTVYTLKIHSREWSAWDGKNGSLMDGSWQTGKLSEKWASRIARNDAEFEALTCDV